MVERGSELTEFGNPQDSWVRGQELTIAAEPMDSLIPPVDEVCVPLFPTLGDA